MSLISSIVEHAAVGQRQSGGLPRHLARIVDRCLDEADSATIGVQVCDELDVLRREVRVVVSFGVHPSDDAGLEAAKSSAQPAPSSLVVE